MSKQLRVSASSLKLYQACPARWAFKQLGHRREPGSKAQGFGIRGHEIAENWLRGGVLPGDNSPEERAFLEGIQHLPAPGTVQVETSFDFEFDGVLWTGRIDFEDPAAQLVGDHKFVGDDRYILNSETIMVDPQAVIYALAHPQWDVSYLEWVYYFKKRHGSKAVFATMPYSYAVEYARAVLLPAAIEMTILTAEFDGLEAANECEKRLDNCMAYGQACFHAGICTH